MNIAAFIAAGALVTASSVEAQFTEVDISSNVNANIQTYVNGNNRQVGGTPTQNGAYLTLNVPLTGAAKFFRLAQ
jgi:hypothetical protein